jgi:hypothetical protein
MLVEVDVVMYSHVRTSGCKVVLFTGNVSERQVMEVITEIAETNDHDLNLPTFVEVLSRTVELVETGGCVGTGETSYVTYTVEHPR